MKKEFSEKDLKIIQDAADLLHEVRTGNDFECDCWEAADALGNLLLNLDIKKYEREN